VIGMVPPPAALVELIGSPVPGSRTRQLVAAVTEALVAAGAVVPTQRRVIELATSVGITFTDTPTAASRPVPDLVDTIAAAGLLIVGTPTHKGTYTGLLKVVLDQVDRYALVGTIAVPVAITASHKHVSSVALALTDLLEEMGATVPAPPLVQFHDLDAAAAARSWTSMHAPAIATALSARTHGRHRASATA
jgi:FMN reductase